MTHEELRTLLADALIYVRCEACDGEPTARGCAICHDLGMIPSRKPVMAAILALLPSKKVAASAAGRRGA